MDTCPGPELPWTLLPELVDASPLWMLARGVWPWIFVGAGLLWARRQGWGSPEPASSGEAPHDGVGWVVLPALLLWVPSLLVLLLDPEVPLDTLTGAWAPYLSLLEWWTLDAGAPGDAWRVVRVVAGVMSDPRGAQWLGAGASVLAVVAAARFARVWMPVPLAAVAVLAVLAFDPLLLRAVEGRLHVAYFTWLCVAFAATEAWARGETAGRAVALGAFSLAVLDQPLSLVWLLVAGWRLPSWQDRAVVCGMAAWLFLAVAPTALLAVGFHAPRVHAASDWVPRLGRALVAMSAPLLLIPAPRRVPGLRRWQLGAIVVVVVMTAVCTWMAMSGARLVLWAAPGVSLLAWSVVWHRFGRWGAVALVVAAFVFPAWLDFPPREAARVLEDRAELRAEAEAALSACGAPVGVLGGGRTRRRGYGRRRQAGPPRGQGDHARAERRDGSRWRDQPRRGSDGARRKGRARDRRRQPKNGETGRCPQPDSA